MTIFFKSYTEIQDELHYVSIFEVIFVQTKTTFRNKMHIVMICRLIVKSVKLTTFSFDRFCVILIDGKRTRKWDKTVVKKKELKTSQQNLNVTCSIYGECIFQKIQTSVAPVNQILVEIMTFRPTKAHWMHSLLLQP